MVDAIVDWHVRHAPAPTMSVMLTAAVLVLISGCNTGTFQPGPDYHGARITLEEPPVVSAAEPEPPFALVGVVLVRQVTDEDRLRAIATRAATKHGAAFAWIVPRRYARQWKDHYVVLVARLPLFSIEGSIDERRIVLYNKSKFVRR